jgi:microsomal dipeptidase-like Zn-dependent dipeptidase
MSDDMIKALAAKGGVIQINYEKSFIDQAYKDAVRQTFRRCRCPARPAQEGLR